MAVTEQIKSTFDQLHPFIVQFGIPAAIGTVIVETVFSPIKKLFKFLTGKESRRSSEIGRTFWTLGKKYKILAVHKYALSDTDPSGYVQLSQNSRPDQWRKLIKVSSLLGCKHHVAQLNPEDILTVVISTKNDDFYQNIYFNQ